MHAASAWFSSASDFINHLIFTFHSSEYGIAEIIMESFHSPFIHLLIIELMKMILWYPIRFPFPWRHTPPGAMTRRVDVGAARPAPPTPHGNVIVPPSLFGPQEQKISVSRTSVFYIFSALYLMVHHHLSVVSKMIYLQNRCVLIQLCSS